MFEDRADILSFSDGAVWGLSTIETRMPQLLNSSYYLTRISDNVNLFEHCISKFYIFTMYLNLLLRIFKTSILGNMKSRCRLPQQAVYVSTTKHSWSARSQNCPEGHILKSLCKGFNTPYLYGYPLSVPASLMACHPQRTPKSFGVIPSFHSIPPSWLITLG
jgi:hypothetical protein